MIPVQVIESQGLFDYQEALALQRKLFQDSIQKKQQGEKPDNYFILCEHPPVYTLGKRADEKNILFDQRNPPANVVSIERGGDITFHGPGQIVGYPILDLEQFNLGLKEYVYRIEEMIIQVLLKYNISGARDENATGVWIAADTEKARKICAIGIKASRYVTMHGFAFNIQTNLNYFDHIIPCGIVHKEVTSLAKECAKKIEMNEVKQFLLDEFSTLFKADLSLIAHKNRI